MRAPNSTKCGDDIGPSSMFIRFVSGFRYLAQFRNARGSNDSGVENRGKISHFLPLSFPEKIAKGGRYV